MGRSCMATTFCWKCRAKKFLGTPCGTQRCGWNRSAKMERLWWLKQCGQVSGVGDRVELGLRLTYLHYTRVPLSVSVIVPQGGGAGPLFTCAFSHLSPAFLVTVWLLNNAGQGVLLDSEGMLRTLQARGIPTSCDLLFLSFVFEHHTLRSGLSKMDNSFLIPSQFWRF